MPRKKNRSWNRETSREIVPSWLLPQFGEKVWAAIAEKQLPIPVWVVLNSTCGWTREEDEWIGTICLFKRRELEEGYYWETQSDGRELLVHIDPKTGQKMIVIIYDVPDEDRVEIFKAKVNIITNEVTFITETTLANLDRNDFDARHDIPREELNALKFSPILRRAIGLEDDAD